MRTESIRDRQDAKTGPHRSPVSLSGKTLLRSFDGCLAEILHQLGDGDRSLAGTRTSGLVALRQLKIGVFLELCNLSIDLFEEFFHGFWFVNIIVNGLKIFKKALLTTVSKLGSFN